MRIYTRVTAIVAIALLIATAFRVANPPRYEAILQVLIWVGFVFLALGSIIHYFLYWRDWPRPMYPFAICLVTILILTTPPFHYLQYRLEFRRSQVEFDDIVSRIEKGRLIVNDKNWLGVNAPHRT